MRKATEKLLKKHNACTDGFEWWAENCKGLPIEKQLLKTVNYRADWANWAMVRLLNRKDKIRYAIFAAELVLDIFEEKYPNDDRPRKAIEAAREVVGRGSKKNRSSAASAASAAYVASAASAASVASAASAASADSANSARENIQVKIIEYGIKLLKDK